MKAIKIRRFPDPDIDRQFEVIVNALHLPSMPLIPEYASNAAALAAGQNPGDVYHTAGTVKIVVPA